MIEIRSLALHEYDAARALVVAANDAPYDFAPVAEEKIFGPGFAGSPGQIAAIVDSRLAGIAVVSGRFLRLIAVDRALRRRGVGRALLAEVERRIRTAHEEIVVGAEGGNYFTPGISQRDAATIAFFDRAGYLVTGTSTNLHSGLEKLLSTPNRARRAATYERSRVLEWVGETFGAIWAFETDRAFEASEPTVFIAEANGEIQGFAVCDADNRGLGTFGPAGVRSSSRSSGVGGELLLAALADLRRLGYARAVIQWAGAHEFYRKVCGAVPAEEFAIYSKLK